jgi:hypothetical protein
MKRIFVNEKPTDSGIICFKHSHTVRGSLRYAVHIRVRGTLPLEEFGTWGVYRVGTLWVRGLLKYNSLYTKNKNIF